MMGDSIGSFRADVMLALDELFAKMQQLAEDQFVRESIEDVSRLNLKERLLTAFRAKGEYRLDKVVDILNDVIEVENSYYLELEKKKSDEEEEEQLDKKEKKLKEAKKKIFEAVQEFRKILYAGYMAEQARLEKELADAIANLEDADHVAELEGQIAALKEKIARLKKERKRIKEERERLEGKNKELREEFEIIEEDILDDNENLTHGDLANIVLGAEEIYDEKKADEEEEYEVVIVDEEEKEKEKEDEDAREEADEKSEISGGGEEESKVVGRKEDVREEAREEADEKIRRKKRKERRRQRRAAGKKRGGRKERHRGRESRIRSSVRASIKVNFVDPKIRALRESFLNVPEEIQEEYYDEGTVRIEEQSEALVDGVVDLVENKREREETQKKIKKVLIQGESNSEQIVAVKDALDEAQRRRSRSGSVLKKNKSRRRVGRFRSRTVVGRRHGGSKLRGGHFGEDGETNVESRQIRRKKHSFRESKRGGMRRGKSVVTPAVADGLGMVVKQKGEDEGQVKRERKRSDLT